jgi:integrase
MMASRGFLSAVRQRRAVRANAIVAVNPLIVVEDTHYSDALIRKRGKTMANAHLKLVTPTGKIPTITTPRRAKNGEYRTREHLTEAEVERLIEATTSHRDATMILVAFRHGLRASELVDLRWDQVDFELGVLHIRRAKAGTPATHPLTGRELRALRRLQRETGPSTHVFMSERKAPISADGFQKMIERLSERAKLGFPVHAHMLRHACGFKMADDGVDTRTIQAYLGHKDIRHYPPGPWDYV